jgi:hypothetical protein
MICSPGLVLRLALAAAVLAGAAAASKAAGRRLLVLDLEIVDTSNEPGDHRADHQRRLALARDAIAERISQLGVYEIADRGKIAADLAAILERQYLHSCNGCERRLGEGAGADFVLTGVVNKVSTLIMALKVSIRDVKTGELAYMQTFDFRGDTDQSWTRAARYFVDRLAQKPPG